MLGAVACLAVLLPSSGTDASPAAPGGAPPSGAAFVPPGHTDLASVASGLGTASAPATSADGRHVAFQSGDEGLVPGDRNRAQDVFVFDALTRLTNRVSVASDGTEADAPSGGSTGLAGTRGVDWEPPAISGDGRFVAFTSTATNLVTPARPGAVRGRQVYVRDRDVRGTGRFDTPGNTATFLASAAGGRPCAQRCTAGRGDSHAPSIATAAFDSVAEGRTHPHLLLAVAFSSAASDLVAGASGEQVYVSTVDVALEVAAALVPGAGDPFAGGSLEVASATAGGTAGNGPSRSPSVAAQVVTGPTGASVPAVAVAFSSEATDLVQPDAEACTAGCRADVFVRTLSPGMGSSTALVSRGRGADGAMAADGASTEPSVAAVAPAPGGPASGATSGSAAWSVAFSSVATNLVEPGVDTNRMSDVFAAGLTSGWDAAGSPTATAGSTTRSSVATDGAQADGPSHAPVIAPDGRVVAFASDAANLDAAGADAGHLGPQVYLRDRDVRGVGALDSAGSVRTARIGPAVPDPESGAAVAPRGAPALGGTGEAVQVVVATSTGPLTKGLAGHLLAARWDRRSAAGVGPVTVVPAADATDADVSADGRWVAFASADPHLVAADRNGSADVFVQDTTTGQVSRVSVAADGTERVGGAARPTISADGRYVAFQSSADLLGPASSAPEPALRMSDTGSTDGASAVYVVDRRAEGPGALVRLAGGAGRWLDPDISADGRWVAFTGDRSDLVAGMAPLPPGSRTLFVADRGSGAVTNLAVGFAPGRRGGTLAPATGLDAATPSVSADGRFVAFTSTAASLLPGGAGRPAGQPAIYVVDRDPGDDGTFDGGNRIPSVVGPGGEAIATDIRTELASLADDGSPLACAADQPSISDDGNHVAFRTVAADGSVASPPVAPDVDLVAVAGTPLTVPAPGVLAGASGVGLVASGPATGGRGSPVHVASDGSLLYAAGAAATGTERVPYTATDACGRTATGTATVRIVAAPAGAFAAPRSIATKSGDAVTVPAPGLLAGSVGAVTATSEPKHGALAVGPGGSFTYTPAAGFEGDDSFTYTTAVAGRPGTSTATVAVHVGAPATPTRHSVLVRDRSAGRTALASGRTGYPASDSGSPALAGTGRFVAFTSGDGTGAPTAAFAADLSSGRSGRVSVATDGTDGRDPGGRPASSAAASVDRTGRRVVFVTDAAIVAGQGAASRNAFTRSLDSDLRVAGSTAADGSIPVSNDGFGPVTVTDASVAGAEAGAVDLSGCRGLTLYQGDTCTLTALAASTAAPGNPRAEVTIRTDEPGEPATVDVDSLAEPAPTAQDQPAQDQPAQDQPAPSTTLPSTTVPPSSVPSSSVPSSSVPPQDPSPSPSPSAADPNLTFTMATDGTTVAPGDSVTWSMSATWTLSGLYVSLPSVSSDVCGSALSAPVKSPGDSDALLENGETWTWSCTTVVYTPTTNTATFGGCIQTVGPALVPSAVPSDCPTSFVDATAAQTVYVQTLDLVAGMYPDPPVVHKGETVTWVVYAQVASGSVPAVSVGFARPPTCDTPIVGPTKTGGGSSDNPDWLEVGETWTWTCTSVVDAPIYNDIGIIEAIADTEDSDSVDLISQVDMLDGALNVTKEAVPPLVVSGLEPSWRIRATTDATLSYYTSDGSSGPVLVTYPVGLTNITVDDPTCAPLYGPTYTFPGTNSDDILGPGEEWVWSCTSPAATAPVDNHVDVVGYPAPYGEGEVSSYVGVLDCWPDLIILTLSGSQPGLVDSTPDPSCRYQGSDDATADVFTPTIDIVKTVDKPIVLSGTTVTWSMAVSAPDDRESFVDVVVTDPGCGSPISGPAYTTGDTDALLEYGEVWTYTCTSVITADTTNTATVDASLPYDPFYSCYPESDDPLPECTATDTDDESVDMIAPAISLTKAVDKPVVVAGTVVSYTMQATESGDGTPLANVTLTDPGCLSAIQGPDKSGGDSDDLLEAGETWRWTCSAPVPATTINVATVDAVDALIESPVTDTARVPVEAIRPNIALTKVADKPSVVSGTTVTWTMAATLAPDYTPVDNVTLNDPGCGSAIAGPVKTSGGGADPTPSRLDAGDTWTWTCTSIIVVTTINTATVYATNVRTGDPVSATATAKVEVVAPAVALTKSVDKPFAKAGTVVTWTMQATVAGDGTVLSAVTLTDPRCGTPLVGPVRTGGNNDANLQPGETWTWTCTTTVTVTTVNIARVTAVDVRAGSTVSAEATATVRLVAAGLKLDKRAYWDGTPGGVLWAVEATTGGDGTALKDVKITDVGCAPLIGPTKGGGDDDDVLESGESWIWLCKSVVPDYAENVALVSAVDVLSGSSVSAGAKAIVYNPTITLTPTAGQQGTPVDVRGKNFPPGVNVRLGWNLGIPNDRQAVAGLDRGFLANFLVFRHDPLGPRQMEAKDFLEPRVINTSPWTLVLPVAVAPYVVRPLTFQPPQWKNDPDDNIPGFRDAIDRAIRSYRGDFLSLVSRG